jgi:hypothetical protein
MHKISTSGREYRCCSLESESSLADDVQLKAYYIEDFYNRVLFLSMDKRWRKLRSRGIIPDF